MDTTDLQWQPIMGWGFTIKGTLNHLIITVADNEYVDTQFSAHKVFLKTLSTFIGKWLEGQIKQMFLGASQQHGVNRITKISYGNLCVMEKIIAWRSIRLYLQLFLRRCLSYLRYLCLLRVVVSNSYGVVFLLWFSSSCIPYAASFSELFFFDCPFGIPELLFRNSEFQY